MIMIIMMPLLRGSHVVLRDTEGERKVFRPPRGWD